MIISCFLKIYQKYPSSAASQHLLPQGEKEKTINGCYYILLPLWEKVPDRADEGSIITEDVSL
jgi:hypothetical protein